MILSYRFYIYYLFLVFIGILLICIIPNKYMKYYPIITDFSAIKKAKINYNSIETELYKTRCNPYINNITLCLYFINLNINFDRINNLLSNNTILQYLTFDFDIYFSGRYAMSAFNKIFFTCVVYCYNINNVFITYINLLPIVFEYYNSNKKASGRFFYVYCNLPKNTEYIKSFLEGTIWASNDLKINNFVVNDISYNIFYSKKYISNK